MCKDMEMQSWDFLVHRKPRKSKRRERESSCGEDPRPTERILSGVEDLRTKGSSNRPSLSARR